MDHYHGLGRVWVGADADADVGLITATARLV
jgi:hypothetical protein